jgi:hypothetical protein
MYIRTIQGGGKLLLLASFLFLLVGCDDSGTSRPEPETVTFEDLTEREDIIHNLVLSYREKDINEYSKLLLRTNDTYSGSTYASGYIWYHQPGAVGSEEDLTGEEDLFCTNHIFLAASGTPVKPEHPIIYGLTLAIYSGTWSAVDSLFGEECEDCWYTERQYYIFLEMVATDLHRTDNVQFYIVPVDEDGKKIYKIAVAKDIHAE